MIFFENCKHALSQSVADICTAAGETIIDLSTYADIDAALAANGTPSALVLTPPQRCEAKALHEAIKDAKATDNLSKDIHKDAMDFLSNCSAITQAMMVQKAGVVLFLGIDDVSAGFVGLPQSPIANQLRVSALRSLAKEYGRMGISYNAILTQPAKESVEPQVWRDKRNQLKVYTMRFSPHQLDEYANFCARALTHPMPVNGGLISLGKGVMEMSA